jgi:hypothetical protein
MRKPVVVRLFGVRARSRFGFGAIGFGFVMPFSISVIRIGSYWRSFDDLERFARSSDDPHLGAWRRFNQAVGGDGSAGIWHETYLVAPGQYEALYGNMPRFGLAAATQHVPAVGRRETARRRLGGDNDSAVPFPQVIER